MAFLDDINKEMIKEKNLKITKAYLYAIYGKPCVNGFVKRYGSDVLYHQSILDENDHRVYCYPVAENIILSKYKMNDMADRATKNIKSLLLTSVKTQRTLQNPRPVYLYTWLVSGADSRPIAPSGELKWTDKRNGQLTCYEYQRLISTVTRQLRENRSLEHATFLAADIENPWHQKHAKGRLPKPENATVRDIYSHCHSHGLIATTDLTEVKKMQKTLRDDFIKIFGYKPTLCTVRPLTNQKMPAVVGTGVKMHDSMSLTAVDMFIHYIFKDYHVQLKDCDDFGKLPHQIQHVIAMAQLNSTKRKRCQRYVSDRKAEMAIDTYKFIKGVLDLTAWAISHKADKTSLLRLQLVDTYYNLIAKIISTNERVSTRDLDFWDVQFNLVGLAKIDHISRGEKCPTHTKTATISILKNNIYKSMRDRAVEYVRTINPFCNIIYVCDNSPPLGENLSQQ